MTDLAVIMSVYQNDKLEYLEKSVESILTQTYSNFDFYIVFDGPVSSEIEKYVTRIKDDRIRLFCIEKNGGLAKALNYLLEIVLKNHDYELIARMDADDLSVSCRFEKQRSFLSDNPDISCVGCWYQEIDASDRHLSDLKLPVKHEDLKKLYFVRSPFAHPSVMYRKRFIEMVGFYPTETVFMEDNVFWGKALAVGLKFANIPEFLLKFRIDERFYLKRSGLKYGWNFIKTRFEINKTLKFPMYFYLFSFLIGVIKMMPAFILRYFYLVERRYISVILT